MKITELDPGFKDEISREPGGENIKRCFNCTGCTLSCPVTEIDPRFNPRRILRKAILGMRSEVLESPLIWLCASCYLCYERCPQNVKITEVMGAIRQIARREARAGRIKLESNKNLFDEAFTESVRKHGRWHEASVTLPFLLKTRGLKGVMEYMPLSWEMFKKGKVQLLPHRPKDKEQLQHLFEEEEI